MAFSRLAIDQIGVALLLELVETRPERQQKLLVGAFVVDDIHRVDPLFISPDVVPDGIAQKFLRLLMRLVKPCRQCDIIALLHKSTHDVLVVVHGFQQLPWPYIRLKFAGNLGAGIDLQVVEEAIDSAAGIAPTRLANLASLGVPLGILVGLRDIVVVTTLPRVVAGGIKVERPSGTIDPIHSLRQADLLRLVWQKPTTFYPLLEGCLRRIAGDNKGKHA